MELQNPYLKNLSRTLWYLLAGTRGGEIRAKLLMLLMKRPYNAHQIAKTLELDYKTVEHHIRVLKQNNIITTNEGEKKYGMLYFLTPLLENNIEILDEILVKLGKKDIKGSKAK
ncbi:MAG: winged helix-turn-helix domain-containing protein [Nanoarchaeota archaeon]|nr:winged helix-turn-helix domain-containing protein [Nanoarchaeota archaeon]